MENKIWLINEEERGLGFELKGQINKIFKDQGLDYTEFKNESFISGLVGCVFVFLEKHNLARKEVKALSFLDLRNLLSSIGYPSMSTNDIVNEANRRFSK